MLLLTGATGYLGSGIARELMDRREPFRVLVRDRTRLGYDPATCCCQVSVGDVSDRAALRSALQGVDEVIHTAGLAGRWVRDRRDFQRVNVEGLQNLLHTAEDAGVQRVVYTSSFLALGPSWNVNSHEGLRHRGHYCDAYEESKARALAWLRKEGLHGVPVIALLPGLIYGPGPRTDGNLVGGMIDQYLAGTFLGIIGNGKQRWSFAYIDNVVKAHLAALKKGKPGEEYLLGGDNRTLNDFFRILEDITHVRNPVRHLTFTQGKIAGVVELLRARAFGHSPRLTPEVVEISKHDWVYSSAKAIRDLDYQVSSLEEGLPKTVEQRRPTPIPS